MININTIQLIAYIGPGAGFAISFSIFTAFMVIFGIIFVVFFTPVSIAFPLFFRHKRRYPRYFRKVVILGLDGFDPKIAARLICEGKLPNCKALSESGTFQPLKTTMPSLSPSVWSSFMTGSDASFHSIYDFITRNPISYQPRLSSSEIVRSFNMGIPLKNFQKISVRMLRKGTPFWKELGMCGLESTILRVPITFPPEPFSGRLLSGMCIPDLQGTQGTYSLYATEDYRQSPMGGSFHKLAFSKCRAKTKIIGPPMSNSSHNKNTFITLRIKVVNYSTVILYIQGMKFRLNVGKQSDWIRLCFKDGLSRVYGLVKFQLISVLPNVAIYMTPIQIDPEKAAMPISYPRYFSDYIAKQIGSFGTLGLMEDTTALNDGVLDERSFLAQAMDIFRERKAMFVKTVKRKRDDMTICVFDTSDRIQHMFWRDFQTSQTKRGNQDSPATSTIIDQMYIKMDRLIGETMKILSKKTLFLVISDHGFTSFMRGVNLNTWLYENGYLYLKNNVVSNQEWLADIDWSRTKAYAIGLSGIFVNLQGRESGGIVDQGEQYNGLVAELKAKLESLQDLDATDDLLSEMKNKPIRRVVITQQSFRGPYRTDGPDLLIGYSEGYRCSWECAKGQLSEKVFCDNDKAWSGDHCVDPEIVPGVLFSNFNFRNTQPDIRDIAPTVFDVFGLTPHPTMQGTSLFSESISSPKTTVQTKSNKSPEVVSSC